MHLKPLLKARITGVFRKISDSVSEYPAPAGDSPLYSVNIRDSGSRNASSREAVLAGPNPVVIRARRSSFRSQMELPEKGIILQCCIGQALGHSRNRFRYPPYACFIRRREEKRCAGRAVYCAGQTSALPPATYLEMSLANPAILSTLVVAIHPTASLPHSDQLLLFSLLPASSFRFSCNALVARPLFLPVRP